MSSNTWAPDVRSRELNGLLSVYSPAASHENGAARASAESPRIVSRAGDDARPPTGAADASLQATDHTAIRERSDGERRCRRKWLCAVPNRVGRRNIAWRIRESQQTIALAIVCRACRQSTSITIPASTNFAAASMAREEVEAARKAIVA